MSRLRTAFLVPAVVLAPLFAGVPAATAAIYVVQNTGDAGPGSLRQAMLEADASPGLDEIHFDLPGSGPYVIQPLSALPVLTDPVAIDGSTQPGFAGRPSIELDGTRAGSANGLYLTGGNSTVRALAVNRFRGFAGIVLETGGNNVIAGNFVGTDATGTLDLGNLQYGVLVVNSANNLIGGTEAAARNVVSGNDLSGVQLAGASSSGNLVQGNFIGTDATGTNALGNTEVGVLIFHAPNNLIGGAASGQRNVISANELSGIEIAGFAAAGNEVAGNYIGTDASATVPMGNGQSGVFISQAHNNVIGGSAGVGANVIVANALHGIDIDGLGAYSNVVQGNIIGTTAGFSGQLGNRLHGVFIGHNASANRVGGTSAGAGNLIAFNGGDGVFVESGLGNLIQRNALAHNNGLGIDLGADGVTPNDPGDGDSGPNNLQNFPELAAADASGGTLIVTGSIDGGNSAVVFLEFFGSSACDPSGHGEGELYLGSHTLMNTGGPITFTVELDLGPGFQSQWVTATATDAGNNTSEFCACRTITRAAAPRLSIARESDVSLELSWPANGSDFTLEETERLAPVQWRSVAAAPVFEGGRYRVSVSAALDARFYRLRR